MLIFFILIADQNAKTDRERALQSSTAHTVLRKISGKYRRLHRAPKDYPILASAIHAGVDILIIGDKDFEPVNIERPEILKISDFMEKYDQ